MKMEDMMNRDPETPDKANELIGQWENIVALFLPTGLMIFESESQVYKFMKDEPNFFPADMATIPMKRGRVYQENGKAYADFGEWTLHFS